MSDQYEPLKVEVTNHPQPAHRSKHRAMYQTVVLTSTDGAQEILPQDDDRIEAYVQPLDNDIVIGPTKGVVQAAVNQVTSVPQPNGTYIPKSNTVPYRVLDNGPVFAGITVTSSNSRVSVAAYYRVPG